MKEELIMVEYKFDLKLTKREQYIIQNDMSLFGCEKVGTFCNRVFGNYYKQFKCPDWDKLACKIKISKADQKIGTGVKLKKEYWEILDSEINKKFESDKKYTDKQQTLFSRNYVNYLWKEYANKEMYERERIYFKEKFDIIKNAKDLKKQVQITTGGRYFQCSIHDIMNESGNTYIICKSAEIKEGKLDDWKYASFRFLYITDVREAEKIDSVCINEYDEINIQDKIFYNGIQFFLDDVQRIKVRFTDVGIKKYNSIRNLRPAEDCGWDIKDKEKKEAFIQKKKRDDLNNIKTFECTRKQIEYYLFQFGGDAEILEPRDLREEFLEKYKNAVATYSKTE